MKVPEYCQACEDLLRERRQLCIDEGIYPRQIAIIDNMMERRLELHDVYKELHTKLTPHPKALYVFFDFLLGTADVWSPNEIAQARATRVRLDQVNHRIADVALELAQLLAERTEIHNTSGFRSDTHSDVFEVIDVAARDNGSYKMWLKPELAPLRARYDVKYRPTLSDFVAVLAVDAETATSVASDSITAAATDGLRPSLYDFLRALSSALRGATVSEYGCIPDDFRLSAPALASIVNCVLNLAPDKLVDAPYIKRWRQSERDAAARDARVEDDLL